MKKLVVVAAVVALALFAKKQMSSGSSPSMLQSIGIGSSQNPAQERFEKFMKSWKDGGVSLNDAEQAAACRWARGKAYLAGEDEVRNAAESFDRWRKAKGLYVQDIDYKIGDYRVEGDHTIADVTINGTKYRIGIPKDASPMFWAD